MANLNRKGLTFPAFAALGLAVFGAYKYKQSQKTQKSGGPEGMSIGTTTPSASGINVGTGPAAAV